MSKVKKWFGSMSTQEKVMFVFIVLLLACVVIRWQVISSEVSGAFKDRFIPDTEAVEETPSQTDSISD